MTIPWKISNWSLWFFYYSRKFLLIIKQKTRDKLAIFYSTFEFVQLIFFFFFFEIGQLIFVTNGFFFFFFVYHFRWLIFRVKIIMIFIEIEWVIWYTENVEIVIPKTNKIKLVSTNNHFTWVNNHLFLYIKMV